MPIAVTEQIINEYQVPLNHDELVEQNIYLKTVNRGQAIALSYLERENEQLINEALRLAADNDRLTGTIFESPYLVPNEFVV